MIKEKRYVSCDVCGRPLPERQRDWMYMAKRKYFMDMVGGVTIDVKFQAPHSEQGDLCADCIWESLGEARRYIAPQCLNISCTPRASRTKEEWRKEAQRLEALLRDIKTIEHECRRKG